MFSCFLVFITRQVDVIEDPKKGKGKKKLITLSLWDTMYILKLLAEPYTPTLGLLTDRLTYLSTECSYKIGKGKILIWPNSYKVSGSRSPG